ncbi:hypothetical protein BTVI_02763 [Pitangus sulphuratus]|nr:hypothetical protein BTVI_02763 [Pitangus sulphuratus]
MPASSRMDFLLLAKDKPIRSNSNASVITYLRTEADWKVANIVLIFKKGKKQDNRNYRPVSLASVPGKVMEKIILGSIEKQ